MRCCSEIGANFSRLMSSESLGTLQTIARTQLCFTTVTAALVDVEKDGTETLPIFLFKWAEMMRRNEARRIVDATEAQR
jgi:hypothetical protein